MLLEKDNIENIYCRKLQFLLGNAALWTILTGTGNKWELNWLREQVGAHVCYFLTTYHK